MSYIIVDRDSGCIVTGDTLDDAWKGMQDATESEAVHESCDFFKGTKIEVDIQVVEVVRQKCEFFEVEQKGK